MIREPGIGKKMRSSDKQSGVALMNKSQTGKINENVCWSKQKQIFLFWKGLKALFWLTLDSHN